MRERLRWLGHVLRMKDDRLSNIVLIGQTSSAKWKAGRPWLGWEDVVKKNLREIELPDRGVKKEAWNGWNGALLC